MRNKIYKNLWAGYETYLIKTSSNNKHTNGYLLVNIDGKWILDKGVFYTQDLKYDKEHFQVVGEVDLDKVIINGVLNAIGKMNK